MDIKCTSGHTKKFLWTASTRVLRLYKIILCAASAQVPKLSNIFSWTASAQALKLSSTFFMDSKCRNNEAIQEIPMGSKYRSIEAIQGILMDSKCANVGAGAVLLVSHTLNLLVFVLLLMRVAWCCGCAWLTRRPCSLDLLSRLLLRGVNLTAVPASAL